MEFFGFTIFCSVVIYCLTMMHMQKVNQDFAREEEEKRRKERQSELEVTEF